jgi:hypothetical protein
VPSLMVYPEAPTHEVRPGVALGAAERKSGPSSRLVDSLREGKGKAQGQFDQSKVKVRFKARLVVGRSSCGLL